ncbi:MAG TPA: hypothetical protein VHO67_14750 [Polyangia bacterium]|nr:hypothetical protein [Polyangia bacterium]
MSGPGDTAGGTELEAAARRLTALAERLRAVRAQLEANVTPPGHASGGGVPAGYTPDGDGAKGEAR